MPGSKGAATNNNEKDLDDVKSLDQEKEDKSSIANNVTSTNDNKNTKFSTTLTPHFHNSLMFNHVMMQSLHPSISSSFGATMEGSAVDATATLAAFQPGNWPSAASSNLLNPFLLAANLNQANCNPLANLSQLLSQSSRKIAKGESPNDDQLQPHFNPFLPGLLSNSRGDSSGYLGGGDCHYNEGSDVTSLINSASNAADFFAFRYANNNNSGELNGFGRRGKLSSAGGCHHTGGGSATRYTVELPRQGSNEVLIKTNEHNEEILEVDCGNNRALLYVAKLCQGSKGKSILFEGEWLTPNEFQAMSGRETAKDWKRSIRHRNKSLKVLMNRKILLAHGIDCKCLMCTCSSAAASATVDSSRPNNKEIGNDARSFDEPTTPLSNTSSPLAGGSIAESLDEATPSPSANHHNKTCDLRAIVAELNRKAQSHHYTNNNNNRNLPASLSSSKTDGLLSSGNNNKQQQRANPRKRRFNGGWTNTSTAAASNDSTSEVPSMKLMLLSRAGTHQVCNQRNSNGGVINSETNDSYNDFHLQQRRQSSVQSLNLHQSPPAVIASDEENHRHSASAPPFDLKARKNFWDRVKSRVAAVDEDLKQQSVDDIPDHKLQYEAGSTTESQYLVWKKISDKASNLSKWNIDDVCQYLDSLNLGQYKQAFRLNCINGDSLPLLHEKHLVDVMGMRLGHALQLIACVHRMIGSYFTVIYNNHALNDKRNNKEHLKQ